MGYGYEALVNLNKLADGLYRPRAPSRLDGQSASL